ncbi:ribosomal RNA large subunit methyltransferase N [Pycnococcus provasolii]
MKGRRSATPPFVGYLDRTACTAFLASLGVTKPQHAVAITKALVKRARLAGAGADPNLEGTGEGLSLAATDVVPLYDETSSMSESAAQRANNLLPKDLRDNFPKKALEQLRSNVKVLRDYQKTQKLPENVATPLLVPMTTTVERRLDSKDGRTTKLLVRLQDGNLVETVLMRMDALMGAKGKLDDTVRASKEGGHRRVTVCVSSQVGCLMGCKFCATGTLGLTGSLTAGEILEQVAHAVAICRPVDGGVRNVVFMGQGEPLDNYRAVVEACRCLTDSNMFMLRPQSVCVSTVANLPMNIRRLADEVPKVSLAVSLHAPTQERRLNIVPSAKAAHIEKIMEAIKYHVSKSGRHPMVEYVLLKGVNDTREDARLLGELLTANDFPKAYKSRGAANDDGDEAAGSSPPPSPRGRDKGNGGGGGAGGVVNLIPYNPTSVADVYAAPDPQDVEAFADVLCNPPYMIRTTVRREMGQDIDGACGQLSLKVAGEKYQPGEKLYPDDEDTAVAMDASERMAVDAAAGCASPSAEVDMEDLAGKRPTTGSKATTTTAAAPTTTTSSSSTFFSRIKQWLGVWSGGVTKPKK